MATKHETCTECGDKATMLVWRKIAGHRWIKPACDYCGVVFTLYERISR